MVVNPRASGFRPAAGLSRLVDSEQFRPAPRTCRYLSEQPQRAVSWRGGFRWGAHGPRDKTPIHHAALQHGGRVAPRGWRAAAGNASDWFTERSITRYVRAPPGGVP